ncbi:MFS transporter [Pseudomonas aeruginosa]|uniref:MFS transporter n=1 Tax=Pseudomonas aeruginosa TaxID=287 RepID=UPI000E316B57|nr:MFS transporter [Pseudomonas aeruginosa]MBI8638212.1 MFS transporter [Pseudomonas aeruginosa]MBT9308339.1 MFS transporter [Pseudomonas aeruginosa]RFJ36895.1 DHA2 family efflux MFS transporter permease subunit [Pseudomonas aeruginosa]RFL55862.1 DHA2 family efflux MFS transporter permease subunit [Pseudomonas aeruginosa]RQD05453.1 MFS transporter [Pseudomonas aeruginosa]
MRIIWFYWVFLVPPSFPSARGTLLAAALGFVVVLLDVSVVNVALDALRQEFATDVAGLQWVINAYTLVFAALLLTSGALGDRFGARRVFLLGFVVFTCTSAACGLSGSLPILIAARLIQGLGAALLVPNSLAMLQHAFADREQRSRAVGWWGAFGGMSLAAGPVLGGILVTHLGWRSIFLINLPIGLIGIYLTLCRVAPHEGSHRRSLDWGGQGAAILALAALTMALTEAAPLGWEHGLVQGGFLLAIAATLVFIWIEARSHSPMLPLELFRIPTFTVASVSGVVVNFAYYGLIFVFSLFFQIQQHLSPQLTGLAFLPMTVVLMAVNVLAGRLITRMGARLLMVFGLMLAAFGYLLLMPVSVDGSYWFLTVPMLLAASGTALMVPTMTNATLSSVDASRAGVASGVLNSARQIGGMLGVAVFGYLVRDTAPEAFMRGMHMSIGISVALLLFGSVLCWLGIQPDRAKA